MKDIFSKIRKKLIIFFKIRIAELCRAISGLTKRYDSVRF